MFNGWFWHGYHNWLIYGFGFLIFQLTSTSAHNISTVLASKAKGWPRLNVWTFPQFLPSLKLVHYWMNHSRLTKHFVVLSFRCQLRIGFKLSVHFPQNSAPSCGTQLVLHCWMDRKASCLIILNVIGLCHLELDSTETDYKCRQHLTWYRDDRLTPIYLAYWKEK